MKTKLAFCAALFLLMPPAAPAAIIDSAVPTNAYITKNGLNWAWASPLPADSVGLDLSYQSQFGWRLPTAAELAAAPLATDFLFAGANVPFGGSDPISGANFQALNGAYVAAASAGAIATPYFSTTYRHVDWRDGLGQEGFWAGTAGSNSFSDQLVVRATAALAAPEPATIALAAIGGVVVAIRGGAAAMKRRRRDASA